MPRIYQVRDIAAIVQRLVPGTSIVYTGEVGKDPRDYRVDFTRLGRLLPDFRLEYTLAAGMEELLSRYRAHGFSAGDFDGDQFVRLRTLRRRLDRVTTTEGVVIPANSGIQGSSAAAFALGPRLRGGDESRER